jgi:hypothetical protein
MVGKHMVRHGVRGIRSLNVFWTCGFDVQLAPLTAEITVKERRSASSVKGKYGDFSEHKAKKVCQGITLVNTGYPR